MRIKRVITGWFAALMLPLLMVATVQAAVYKLVDEKGNTTFTDRPPEGQSPEQVELGPITPMGTVSTHRRSETKKTTTKVSDQSYSSLEIISPANEETVRDQENITVKIMTKPDIHTGHIVRLRLGDEVVAESENNLIFNLKNVDRGSHNLTVEILDNNKNVMKSSSSVMHVHRTIITPEGAAATPDGAAF